MVDFIRVLTKHARHCFILCSVTSGLIHTPCTVPSTVSDSIRCASAVVWAGGEQQPTGLQEAECIGPGLHHNVSSLSALICAPNTHTREVSVSLFKNEKRKEKEENSSCRRQPNKSEKQPSQNPPLDGRCATAAAAARCAALRGRPRQRTPLPLRSRIVPTRRRRRPASAPFGAPPHHRAPTQQAPPPGSRRGGPRG
jgi:hypothetical protein